MAENKTYVIKIRKKCLLCSGKCVCSVFKSLKLMNLILNFIFPIESETLYDSFCVTDLQVRFQYRQQQNINFISAILQHAKVQLTQQCKTFILNIYICITNNKHFLYKNLFDITFTLYNVLKLRAYLFGLLDKDPCDSTDLKTEQLFVLYSLMIMQVIMISKVLGNSKVYSLFQVRDHYPFKTFTKLTNYITRAPLPVPPSDHLQK